jgi:hypothetical protein
MSCCTRLSSPNADEFNDYGPEYTGIQHPGRRFHFTHPSGNELGVRAEA